MALSVIDRAVGSYSISIGTCRAIEALTHTGDFEHMEGKAPVHSCDALYVNLRTLFRNAFTAFGDEKQNVDEEIMISSLLTDIENIKEAVSAASPNTVCVFYLCTYPSQVMDRKFPIANFKNANTPNQLFYYGLETDIYNRAEELFGDTVELHDYKLSGNGDTLIITHMPLDLLSANNFPALNLLESYTGAVKPKTQWYTKLAKAAPTIPFNRKMLLLYGDGIMFGPQDLKTRRVMIKVSEKNRWTQRVSDERIILNLRQANEPHVLDFYKKL